LLLSTSCDLLWMSDTASKRCAFSFTFNFGNKQNQMGISPVSREDGEKITMLSVTNFVVFRGIWAGVLSQ
jgi:hypothetical protein